MRAYSAMSWTVMQATPLLAASQTVSDPSYAKNSVPATTQIPNRDSPLFRILVLRQIDSFHGADLITKCIKWQSRNSERQWWDPRRTIRQLTLRQWPTVKDQINRGIPASLTLIRTSSTTPPWR